MRVSTQELKARVVQTGLPAMISGRHHNGDDDPAGHGFHYCIREEDSLEKWIRYAGMLDIKEGTLHVDRMKC